MEIPFAMIALQEHSVTLLDQRIALIALQDLILIMMEHLDVFYALQVLIPRIMVQ
tara:strand:+ start:128 stop:292 length:165 start_codon:yes stop_codon:yes gene_type:complete